MGKCSKCGGEMVQGFIIDQTFGVVNPSDWVEGAPVKSFWSGTDINYKKRLEVKTFRCVGCGFLESYATEENVKDSSAMSELFG